MIPVYELDIYKLSEELSDLIWFEFDNWNKKVQNTTGYQIVRSADSITANIAEGYGRYSIADKTRFNIIACGSFEETKAWLRKLYRRDCINNEKKERIAEIIKILGPKLNSFISKSRN